MLKPMYPKMFGIIRNFDGTEIAYSFSIDDQRLLRAILRAARNKSKKCVTGPLKIEANAKPGAAALLKETEGGSQCTEKI